MNAAFMAAGGSFASDLARVCRARASRIFEERCRDQTGFGNAVFGMTAAEMACMVMPFPPESFHF
ncbi:hypothetical protein [Devosia riboflavina]